MKIFQLAKMMDGGIRIEEDGNVLAVVYQSGLMLDILIAIDAAELEYTMLAEGFGVIANQDDRISNHTVSCINNLFEL